MVRVDMLFCRYAVCISWFTCLCQSKSLSISRIRSGQSNSMSRRFIGADWQSHGNYLPSSIGCPCCRDCWALLILIDGKTRTTLVIAITTAIAVCCAWILIFAAARRYSYHWLTVQMPLLDWASSPTQLSFWPLNDGSWRGWPTTEENTARGASSPALVEPCARCRILVAPNREAISWFAQEQRNWTPIQLISWNDLWATLHAWMYSWMRSGHSWDVT